MPLVNLADESQCVSFYDAVRIGLGRNQGLFFPKIEELPKLPIDKLLAMPFAQRSGVILSALAGGDISIEDATSVVLSYFMVQRWPSKILAHVLWRWRWQRQKRLMVTFDRRPLSRQHQGIPALQLPPRSIVSQAPGLWCCIHRIK